MNEVEENMKVKFEQKFQSEISAAKVWKYLSDPYKVVECVPGAKITEQIDEKTYTGTVSVKIGPVVSNFKGQVLIERLDNDSRELEISGKGMDAKGTGSAEMRMKAKVNELADHKTEVASEMELNVGGKLAQLGARVINDVNNHMFGLFTKNLEQNLRTSEEENKTPESSAQSNTAPLQNESEPVKALPLLFAVIRNYLASLWKKLFKV